MSSESDFIIENGILKKYVGPGGAVVIPEGITGISDAAFSNCAKLTRATFPSSLKSIGKNAFWGCSRQKVISIPEGVEKIGKDAFGWCGELKVEIPSTLKEAESAFKWNTCRVYVKMWTPIFTKLFKEATLEAIYVEDFSSLPEKYRPISALSLIAEKTWKEKSTTGQQVIAYLKKNVTKLCAFSFEHPKLLQFFCNNKIIQPKDIDVFLEEAEKCTDTEKKAMLLNYQNALGQDSVSKAREKKKKEAEAYEDALIKRTAARDPAKGIEGMTYVITGKLLPWPKIWWSREDVQAYLNRYGAKLGASLNKMTDYLVTNDAETGSEKNEKAKRLGVEVITEEAFNQMIGRRFVDAEKIVVPAWVNSIEPSAFSYPDWNNWNKGYGYTKLKEVVLPDGITKIGDKAFAGAKNLERINIPKHLETIGSYVFAGCINLKDVYFSDTVASKKIFAAFDDCPNVTIHAPAGSIVEEYARKLNFAFAAE